MARSISPKELEEVIDGWEYWCPNKDCRNRTFTIDTETDSSLIVSSDGKEQKYLTVRVLICDRCRSPLVIGTNTYYNHEKGWGARGEVITSSIARMHAAAIMSSSPPPHYPVEYIAFTEPVMERTLPEKLPKQVIGSFREAEYAISKNKPISAAAAIRNTVRLIVEGNKIADKNLKDAIKKLPFNEEYLQALSNMKIMGDDTLHFEEYDISDLQPALETLHLALDDYYAHQQRLAQLHKAVSDKASKKAKSNKVNKQNG